MSETKESKIKGFIAYVNNGMWKYGFNREVSDFEEAKEMHAFLSQRGVFNSITVDRDDI